MSNEIRVPDIGDFKNIPVIEVHVKPGSQVKAEDPLITLESDKATLDVPAPQAGTIKELKVKLGDKVSQGSVIAVFEGDAAGGGTRAAPRPAHRRQPAALPQQPHLLPPSMQAPPTSNARCWLSAQAPAAIPQRSAPPTSA